MDLDQIEKLNDLKEKGMISEEEYQQAKARILNHATTPVSAPAPAPVKNMGNQDYSMIMHLSQFCSWIFPVIGIIVPVVMWQSRKEDTFIDQQGRVIMNWVLSALIYIAISSVLCVILIGFFLLGIIALCSIAFTIMGALDASKGIVKNYPLTIKFFSVQETSAQP